MSGVNKSACLLRRRSILRRSDTRGATDETRQCLLCCRSRGRGRRVSGCARGALRWRCPCGFGCLWDAHGRNWNRGC
eukprot:1899117-Prymnesium_polylepis.1